MASPKTNGHGKSRKLRLLSVTLQPFFVLDDGENLTPIQTNTMNISGEDWANIQTLFNDAVETLKTELGV